MSVPPTATVALVGEIEINNIMVTNNKCEVGFYQWTVAPNTWIEYDDVEFFLSSVGSSSVNAIPDSFSQMGVQEGGKNSFSIYPNPISSGSTLNLNSPVSSEYDINITSLSGETVFSRSKNNGDVTTIELPKLQKGVYFIRLRTERASKVERLLVTD